VRRRSRVRRPRRRKSGGALPKVRGTLDIVKADVEKDVVTVKVGAMERKFALKRHPSPYGVVAGGARRRQRRMVTLKLEGGIEIWRRGAKSDKVVWFAYMPREAGGRPEWVPLYERAEETKELRRDRWGGFWVENTVKVPVGTVIRKFRYLRHERDITNTLFLVTGEGEEKMRRLDYDLVTRRGRRYFRIPELGIDIPQSTS